jgi:(p)ppGpp synthase/HD superfamily hydrolase
MDNLGGGNKEVKMSLKDFQIGKELINKAKEFATKCHEGQFRKFDKKPYITHPAAVASLVDKFGGSPEMVATAWLHDVVEDCDVSIRDIIELFGTKVSNLVWELTSPKDLNKSKKAEYLLDKMNTMTSDALTIKLCDRLNNVSDFKTAPQGFVSKYSPETKFILDGLESGGRPLTTQQIKIIDEIRKFINQF